MWSKLEFLQRPQWIPTPSQKRTFLIIAGNIVVILILWNVPYLDLLIFPFKIETVALHEFGHAFAGLVTGAHIDSIELNLNQGGLTRMRGGNPFFTLPGYLGSSFLGALMIFAGFNVFASKVASILLAIVMLMTLYWAHNWLAVLSAMLFFALIIFLWLKQKDGLRYFVIFMGVMSCLYTLWDITDDLVLHKVNESDAAQFAKLIPLPAQFWGLLWLLVSIFFLLGGMLMGLYFFKDSDSAPYLPF